MRATTRACLALVGAATWLVSGAAGAMGITVEGRDQIERAIEAPVTIYLTGPIQTETPEQVRRTLDRYKGEWLHLFLDSPGGDLVAGMELGRVLRTYGVSASVGRRGAEKRRGAPGGCYSACSLAFLGASYRYMVEGSQYGMHLAFRSDGQARPGDLQSGQVIASLVSGYLQEMDLDPSLLRLMARAGPDSMYIFTPGELALTGVVNKGRKAPVWTIEATPGGTFLKGVQETVYGTGKALFACAGGQVGLMSFYTAGDKAAVIASGRWAHSLIIDSDVIPMADPDRIEAQDGEIQTLFRVVPASGIRRVLTAAAVGHTMQMSRQAPTYVGYRVDIDARSRDRVRAYLGNCLVGR